jgi:crossover junction endonuclease MUS81
MLTAEERALDACSSDDQNEPSPKASNTNKSSTSQKKNPKPRRRRKSDALTAAERALDNPSSDSELPNTTKTQSKSCATRNKYIPNKRTGCWGMLVAMSVLTTEGVGPFTKTEIIQLAQEYCDSSYTETASRGGGAGNSGHYTAWNM